MTGSYSIPSSSQEENQQKEMNKESLKMKNIKISTTREAMKTYWEYHRDQSPIHTVETMMLDSNANILHIKEEEEIFSYLPLTREMKVLELASGIGRYTGSLAKQVEHVTSIEFIHEFHETNKRNNQQYNNIEFLCEDVTNLSKNTLSYTSYNMVFSNWLLMYLNDHEIQVLLENLSQFLIPGGYLFFRESCWQPSGDKKHSSENPTYYRHPSYYINAFTYANQYELVSSSNITVYRQMKKNPGQIWFLFQKKMNIPKEITNKNENLSFQQFLDKQQYSKSSIHRYELIFGPGYVSTGGQLTTTEFVNMLDLQPKQYILDVGCGIGGGDVYMAKNFDVDILGVDLSSNMIYEAIERSIYQQEAKDVSDQIRYMISDITTIDLPEETFDVIYSRDTILHISNKQDLFSKFFKWLKPNGKLLISDYCCDVLEKSSENFKTYVKSRGYTLLSVENYGKVIEEAGFQQVQAMDRTKQFLDILDMEMKNTMDSKTEYIKKTSQKDYDDIINGWNSKIERCTAGEQRWGLFYAEKPASSLNL